MKRRSSALTALAVSALLLIPTSAIGHSWYDVDCCHDNDCGPATISYVASDPKSLPVMMVSTPFGTKPVTKETLIRRSKDGKFHACTPAYLNYARCIYVQDGN